ncbi:MAG: hypothetical protein A3J75_05080 [Acidobacteria bacterium RBG_16_68_9]|nr:MAG: hypothetical protein A3J75_05080 [Acidobacteria bacterium RBG_16_68_9]
MRPDYVTDEQMKFLDALRDSGEVNMFGAVPFLMSKFPFLDRRRAKVALLWWMDQHNRPEGGDPDVGN